MTANQPAGPPRDPQQRGPFQHPNAQGPYPPPVQQWQQPAPPNQYSPPPGHPYPAQPAPQYWQQPAPPTYGPPPVHKPRRRRRTYVLIGLACLLVPVAAFLLWDYFAVTKFHALGNCVIFLEENVPYPSSLKVTNPEVSKTGDNEWTAFMNMTARNDDGVMESLEIRCLATYTSGEGWELELEAVE